MKKKLQHLVKKFTYLLLCLVLLFGCEDFLEVETPLGQLDNSMVFESETTATAAVTTLYGKLRDEVLLAGKPEGLSSVMGIYSDEMIYFGFGGDLMDSFYQHRVYSDDLLVKNIWNNSYSLIYMGNAILEGLEGSDGLTAEIKSQLRGETLFIRGLVYSYMVNLFGDIPYVTTTDYGKNSTLSKVPIPEVYERIINDLKEAKTLLGPNYISDERTRANKLVVAALLARVYLYSEQWNAADEQATILISNTSLFNLELDVANEFLKESTSAILQFKPKNEGDNSLEASLFYFESGPPPFVSLNPKLKETMEVNDKRKENWIGKVTDGDQTWYYPNKYKAKQNTGTSIEYSMVFRLSEQYLIRAEARARLGNIPAALEDLNKVRARAGLIDYEANSQSEILDAIIIERFHELFSEFGHRWFNIKRMGIANDILAPIKPGWKPTDVLLPLPESELSMNPNLNPQNPGY
ncbi:MAG: RagB/SusD family nutrient uptake outer membrane protein [Aequorivita sp.]